MQVSRIKSTQVGFLATRQEVKKSRLKLTGVRLRGIFRSSSMTGRNFTFELHMIAVRAPYEQFRSFQEG
jgi:hypothetical protein